jgi:hypothetical protein
MEKYKKDLRALIGEYQDVYDKLTILEKQIAEQVSIQDQLNIKLEDIRRREKEIINNIEKETGEKVTGSKLAAIL